MEIKIRKVDPVIVKKLDELAKSHGISREEYLRKWLVKVATMEDVEKLENKYSNLIEVLADRLEQANDVIESNSRVIEENSKLMSHLLR